MIQTEKEAFWYLPENLTAAQKAGLVQFRQYLDDRNQCAPGYDDDITLLRYLKARQWNVEPAAQMYTHMVEWRRKEEVDSLFHTLVFPELKQLTPHYPHFWHKTDKYGRPVYIELLGKIDCVKMLEVTTQEKILKYHIWTWERLERVLMPACSEVKGHPIRTCVVVLDLAGVSLSSFNMTTKRLLTAITKIDQDYFPEHLGTMFIINAPMIFSAIWAVVNPLLEERTRKKIMVLGSNYLSTVTELIPVENLPTFLGGKSECPDRETSIGPWFDTKHGRTLPWLPAESPARVASIPSSMSSSSTNTSLSSFASSLTLSDSPGDASP